MLMTAIAALLVLRCCKQFVMDTTCSYQSATPNRRTSISMSGLLIQGISNIKKAPSPRERKYCAMNTTDTDHTKVTAGLL